MVIILLAMTGCSNDTQTALEPTEVQTVEKSNHAAAESIAATYRDIYEEALEANTLGNLEVIRSIVNRLGENGYSAVDEKNQIDMVGAERVVQFCKKVDEKEEAEITMIVVSYDGSFTKYDFSTADGKVIVDSGYYVFKNESLENTYATTFDAYAWLYTEEGYLFFEQYHMPGYDGPSGHTALRVQPLDEKCRELNRQYILPIGYEQNDLFLSDWSEEDFGEINFYDLFDIFYPILHEKESPYAADDNFGADASYRIPREEFESVIMTYFNIDSQTLQSKTTYFQEDNTYEYRPRGWEDCGLPQIPYPEVVNYAENSDGTITLTVNVVYPDRNISKVYAHEVAIRPLADGSFQYVSNRMIPAEDNYEATWHIDRLTREEWQELYGEGIFSEHQNTEEKMTEQMEKGYALPIADSEREEAETDCKRVMELITDIYEHADKGNAFDVVISEETVREMMDTVKEAGHAVTATETYSNMENYEGVEDFLNTSINGSSGSVVLYEIHTDGGIGRQKFIFDGSHMYVLSAKASWSDDNKPIITYITYTRLKEWEYTEKGWFCYELCVPQYPEVTEVVDGGCLIRVKPISEEKREISEKCVLGLGYQGNNLLCSNWDIDHMEDLDYNGMYEYLYAMKYQEPFPSDNYPNGIPKAEFESLIMEYLPITAEQIREYAVFDEQNQTYVWARLGCGNYAPTYFGTSVPEVTDIKANEDGTVTLTVAAVCEMILCNEAVITHELTVRFAEDGSFQYLGNKILDDGIENIPDYQYRINISNRN